MKYHLVENCDFREAFRALWGNLTYGWFLGHREYPSDWKARGYLQPMQKMVGLGPVRIQWATEGQVIPTVHCHLRATKKRAPLMIDE